MSSRKDVRVPAPDFRIGDWLAQPSLNLLSQPATVRHLEPQVMDLLAFLAATGGRVVSKDEIIDAVWEGRLIAEATLTRSIADLRRALGDDQRRPLYIETIAKRGYRLVATVSAQEMNGERIADRLASARHGRFVGRQAEVGSFRAALEADEPPFVAWHIHGAGGVGKTTVMQEFAREASDAGRFVVRIDGRNVEPTVPGFLMALGRALGIERPDLDAAIERWPGGVVLLVDTYEVLSPLDDWLRGTLLPQLPGRSLVVIAGRHEPELSWRTGVDWAALTRITRLGNLGREDSRTYLTRCGVAPEQQDEALAFTRGHPLALALVADVLARGEPLGLARLDTEPEVVRHLLETFVQDVPTREHRLALHASVTAWATTEPMLAAVLGRPNAHELFEWLEHLSFVEHGPFGLFPHDLARDVVFMDFAWRDPDAAARVTERVLGYLYERLGHTHGLDRQRVWFDVLYVQRYNPCIKPYFEWAGFGTAYAETSTAGDRAAMADMVKRHEGHESAAIAGHWLTRQPESFLAIRSVAGDLIGFAAYLLLHEATAEDLAVDPAAAQAIAYVERHGPIRPGERIMYGRFWMDAERHQALTQVFTVVAASWLQQCIAPQTAWCFAMMADPDAIEPMFTDLHIWRACEADFEVDGRRYGVFAHDWRVETVQEWLHHKAARASRLR